MDYVYGAFSCYGEQLSQGKQNKKETIKCWLNGGRVFIYLFKKKLSSSLGKVMEWDGSC